MRGALFGLLSSFIVNSAVADPVQPETSRYEDFLFVESILPKPTKPSFIDPSFYIGSTGITLGTLAASGTSGGSSYTLPIATTATLGGIIATVGSTGQFVSGVDLVTGHLLFGTPTGSITSISGRSGVITLTHTDITDWASATSTFLTTVPVASATVLGGVTISTGLVVDGSGHLSVSYGSTSGTSVQGNDARLNSFSGSTAGIVPSPGSSIGYLKSDGTWSTPGGGGISITNGSLTASGSLNIGSGLTLSGSGSSYTITSTGGGSANLTTSYLTDGQGTTIAFSAGGRSYPSGLIQAFDFTTATGPGVNDPVSGDSATIIGWTSGAQSGLGFTTNGSSTYIQMPSTVMGRFTWTVAVRFKTTSNTSGSNLYNDPSVYSVALNGIGNDGGIQIHNGYANFWCSPGTGDVAYTSTVLINDGNFHTIVYTSDMLAYRLYVDGVYTGVQYNGSITLPWGYGKQISQAPSMGRTGTFDFSSSFQGGLAATFSYMRAWNYKLTDSQIATLDLTQPPQNGP